MLTVSSQKYSTAAGLINNKEPGVQAAASMAKLCVNTAQHCQRLLNVEREEVESMVWKSLCSAKRIETGTAIAAILIKCLPRITNVHTDCQLVIQLRREQCFCTDL